MATGLAGSPRGPSKRRRDHAPGGRTLAAQDEFIEGECLMKRKLLAVLVASALAAPVAALAQASNVQIYGRANLGLDNYSATGSTAGAAADLKSRSRVFDTASRLGVRGTENLGGGLKALFAIESG